MDKNEDPDDEEKIEFDRVEDETIDEPIEDLGTFNEKDILPAEETENPTEENKKDFKQLLVVLGIIIGCFILAFAGIKLFKGDKEIVTIEDLHRMNLEGKYSEINYMYNGYSFAKQGNIWYTQVQNEKGTLFDIPLHFGPKELEDVPLEGEITDDFKKPPLYITFDPLSTYMQYVALSVAEFSTNTVKGFGMDIDAACDKNETNACIDRPIVNGCSPDKAVVYIKESNNTGVIMNGNCVLVNGEGKDLVRATDRLLLKLYRVMG